MPALFELYDKYHGEGLVIIGVHVDISPDGAADSVAQLDKGLAEARRRVWKGRDIPFLVALARHHKVQYGPDIHDRAHCQIAADYGVTSYPTSVLIDRQGRVVGLFEPSSEAGLALLKKTLRDK
jgi:hypothetical protein